MLPHEFRVRKQRRWGIALICLAGIIVSVGGIVRYRLTPQKLDERMCPVDREPVAYYAILVDATDPITRIQEEWISRWFRDSLEPKIPEYGMLQLYKIGENYQEDMKPRFVGCNPGSGRGKNPFWSNPGKLRRRWLKFFKEPLTNELEELLHEASSQKSPIMEMIQTVSVTAFPGTEGTERHLIVVSDLLQNSDDYSQYGKTPPKYEEFRKSRSFHRVYGDLKGLHIVFLYLRRHTEAAEKVQGKSHVRFWEKYLKEQGGKVEVFRVPG